MSTCLYQRPIAIVEIPMYWVEMWNSLDQIWEYHEGPMTAKDAKDNARYLRSLITLVSVSYH